MEKGTEPEKDRDSARELRKWKKRGRAGQRRQRVD